MKKYCYIISLLFASMLFMSCEDEVDIDLPEGEVGLVVDGMVSTLPGPQELRLSLTQAYNDESPSPKVSGAIVQVTDDQGATFNYTETEPGVYHSATSFSGAIGRTYVLSILYDGKEYASTEELLQAVPNIENIRYYYEEDELFKEDGYYVYFDFADDPNETNAYRWIQHYNDTLANTPGDITATDDEFFNGSGIDSLSFNEVLELDDKYKIEMWSLSLGAMDYIQQVSDIASGSGGPFDTPPAPVYGNMRNVNDDNELVWGYFNASDITADSIVIQ